MGDSRLRIDRMTAPGLTMLALHGTIEASFDGNQVAASVKTSKLVINLREVRRFASWGMAEWMNFLRATAKTDLYLVECSTYSVQQMNLVTGLLGHGKLVSFYAPFRCSGCGEEFDTLVMIAQDPQKLHELASSERTCATCGGTARMGKYAADVAATIASRPNYDIDDEVVAFLRTHLKYEIAPNLTRFRAVQKKHGAYSYLRLLGNVATLPAEALARASERTTVVDLAGILFEPTRLDAWRNYVKNASANVDALQLLDCPVGFFEQAVTATDLETKVKIRTFAQQYRCPNCNTEKTAMVDVAGNLEELSAGVVPLVRCPTCKAADMTPLPSSVPLQRLPARERDGELDRFLEKVRTEPDDKLENALLSRPGKSPKGVTRSVVFMGSALAALLVGGLVLAVFFVSKRDDAPGPVTTALGGGSATKPTFHRPDWILSDTPSSSFCQEVLGRLLCVGVSPFSANRDRAVVEANDAALDELVNAVAIKIGDKWFGDNVRGGYSAQRIKLLAAMQNAGPRAEDETVRKTRHRVAELLLASGGPAVPPQRSDWYWEEYENGGGVGTEFLVFVRYDVTLDALKSLIERYSAKTLIRGNSVVATAFPGLAWQYATFEGGAQLVKVAPSLAGANVEPLQVVVSVDDHRVTDASALRKHLAESTTDAVLAIKAGNAEPAKVTLKP